MMWSFPASVPSTSFDVKRLQRGMSTSRTWARTRHSHVIDEHDRFEVVVVFEAPEVQIRGAVDGPTLVDDGDLQMVEVVLIFEDVDAFAEIIGVAVLLRVVGKVDVVPPERGDHEVDP